MRVAHAAALAQCWTGVGLVLIQRRDCVLCLPSEHEALALCLGRHSTRRRRFRVDPTFGQSLVLSVCLFFCNQAMVF